MDILMLLIRTTLITALLIANTSYAAHEHTTHSSSLISACKVVSYLQKCAKTMSSDFDNRGRLWSTWSNDDSLYVNYSDDNGLSFSDAVLVNPIPEKISAGGEHRPKIKVSRTGIIYLSWTQKLPKRFTGHIRFSKSVDRGQSFSTPITVNDNVESISHRFDTLGVSNKGDVYISWLDKRDSVKAKKEGLPYSGAATYFAVLNGIGLGFSKNIKLADNSCECCRMAMDFDNNDLPVIAWRHVYPDNIRDHSIVSFNSKWRFNAPQRLSRDNWKIDGCPHQGPSVSVANDNTYHAVWYNNGRQNHGIFYANSKDSGATFSKALSVGHYESNANHADVLSVDNRVYIVWHEYKNKKYRLYRMESENSGQTWSAPQLVATTLKTPDSPFLIANKLKVYISWHIQGEKFQLLSINNEFPNKIIEHDAISPK